MKPFYSAFLLCYLSCMVVQTFESVNKIVKYRIPLKRKPLTLCIQLDFLVVLFVELTIAPAYVFSAHLCKGVNGMGKPSSEPCLVVL